jgi:hypothetical protein
MIQIIWNCILHNISLKKTTDSFPTGRHCFLTESTERYRNIFVKRSFLSEKKNIEHIMTIEILSRIKILTYVYLRLSSIKKYFKISYKTYWQTLVNSFVVWKPLVKFHWQLWILHLDCFWSRFFYEHWSVWTTLCFSIGFGQFH